MSAPQTYTSRLKRLDAERRRRRDELFEGPTPSYEQFLVARGFDQAMTEVINDLIREAKGDFDDA